MRRSSSVFGLLLAGTALPGAALVLLTPAAVGGRVAPWLPVVLAVVTVGFALAARRARPDRPTR